jgi:hypothetical protein
VQVIEKTQEAGLKPGTTFGKEGKRTGKAKQGKEAKTGLAKGTQIEVDVHFVAFGGNDIDGGGVRRKLGSGEG